MLTFDIDADDLMRIAREMGASEAQVRKAFNRALTRTAATLRRRASRELKQELALRNAAALRRRLKTIRLKGNKRLNSIALWFGANDMPVSAFKGRAKKTASGAAFRGVEFPGGFVAKGRAGRNTIFRRVRSSRLPIAEAQLPVRDKMEVFVEDEIFPDLDEIFFKHFTSDLRARVNFNVGR